MTRLAYSSVCACSRPASPLAQESRTPTRAPAAAEKAKDEKDGDEKAAKEEKPPSVTRHQMTIGGKPFAYTATAGYMPMKDENGKLKANIFFIAYTKDGASPRRPITFAFNGGPGSSSVWLHMGALGPKRVVMTDEGWAPAAPLPARRQRADLARVHRPRLHRSGHDRLQPPRRRGEARAVPRPRRGHPVRRRVHPPLRDEVRPLGRAEVPRRRELRHDARRRAVRLPPAAARHVPERHHRSSRRS